MKFQAFISLCTQTTAKNPILGDDFHLEICISPLPMLFFETHLRCDLPNLCKKGDLFFTY